LATSVCSCSIIVQCIQQHDCHHDRCDNLGFSEPREIRFFLYRRMPANKQNKKIKKTDWQNQKTITLKPSKLISNVTSWHGSVLVNRASTPSQSFPLQVAISKNWRRVPSQRRSPPWPSNQIAITNNGSKWH
jgi:hypothetical protein